MFVQTAFTIRALNAARDYKHSRPGAAHASAAATTAQREESLHHHRQWPVGLTGFAYSTNVFVIM